MVYSDSDIINDSKKQLRRMKARTTKVVGNIGEALTLDDIQASTDNPGYIEHTKKGPDIKRTKINLSTGRKTIDYTESKGNSGQETRYQKAFRKKRKFDTLRHNIDLCS